MISILGAPFFASCRRGFLYPATLQIVPGLLSKVLTRPLVIFLIAKAPAAFWRAHEIAGNARTITMMTIMRAAVCGIAAPVAGIAHGGGRCSSTA